MDRQGTPNHDAPCSADAGRPARPVRDLGYNWPDHDAPPRLRRAPFAELTPFEVYGLCRLRVDVFVVEQECPYPELDGRDLEPATVHVWFEDDDGRSPPRSGSSTTATTRAIGRVATAAGYRGRGLAARLMEEGIAMCARLPGHARRPGLPRGLVRALRLPDERPGLRRGRHPARADAPRAGLRPASRAAGCAAWTTVR